MIEIEMENELGLKIFINGVPDIKEIPPDKLESLLAVLEMQISKYAFKIKNCKKRVYGNGKLVKTFIFDELYNRRNVQKT